MSAKEAMDQRHIKDGNSHYKSLKRGKHSSGRKVVDAYKLWKEHHPGTEWEISHQIENKMDDITWFGEPGQIRYYVLRRGPNESHDDFYIRVITEEDRRIQNDKQRFNKNKTAGMFDLNLCHMGGTFSFHSCLF